MIAGIIAAKGTAIAKPVTTRLLLANGGTLNFYSYKNPLTTFDFVETVDSVGSGICAIWSPSGRYAALGSTSSPYLLFAKRSGDTLSTIAPTGTVPTNDMASAAWSADESVVYVAASTSPRVFKYARSGDVFTFVSSPASVPAGNPPGSTAASLSPDGAYLAIAHATSPYITVYRTSDWTKLSDPSTLPVGTANGCAWHPSGNYLAVAHATSPRVTLYSFASETLTKIADPAVLPPGTCNGIAWNASGSLLAITGTATPFWTLYSFSGGVLTNISTASKTLAGAGYGVGWSGDESVFIGHSGGERVTGYPVLSGVIGTAYTGPTTDPTTAGNGVSVVSTID